MAFLVTQPCRALGLRAAAILFRGVSVGPRSAELHTEIEHEVAALRARHPDPTATRSLPEVVAFGEVLRRVGVNPRRKRPTPDRLLSVLLERGDLPAIHNLVDAYNLVSVRHLCSLGAHDLDRISLPVSLRLLTGTEQFTPLGSDTPVAVAPGEFGYVDASEQVLCRFDLLQAEFSKVTSATNQALLIVEATAQHPPGRLAAAVAEAVARITHHCGGTAEVIEAD